MVVAALPPTPHAVPAAKAITTPLSWDEMALEDATRAEIGHILAWARHEPLVQRVCGLSHWLKPGYRALFYGSPARARRSRPPLSARPWAGPCCAWTCRN